MPSKHSTTDKSEPATPDKAIVSQEEEDNLNNEKDRQQMMADSDYYRGEGHGDERLKRITEVALRRAALRGFESGYEEKDWQEAEAEIDSISESGDSD